MILGSLRSGYNVLHRQDPTQCKHQSLKQKVLPEHQRTQQTAASAVHASLESDVKTHHTSTAHFIQGTVGNEALELIGAETQLSDSGNHRVTPPHLLTRKLVACQTVEELRTVIDSHRFNLNAVHVSAALVKLAKLCTASKSHPTHAPDASQPWSVRQGRRFQPSKDLDPTVVSRDSLNLQESLSVVEQLVVELGQRYIEHAPDYSTARQHANVCWALGQLRSVLKLQPAHEVLTALENALLASNSQVLQTANSQELANVASGLVHLRHFNTPLLIPLCESARQRIESFSPQELSNFAWAAAHVCRNLPQQQSELRHDAGSLSSTGGARSLQQDTQSASHILYPRISSSSGSQEQQLHLSLDHVAHAACPKIHSFKTAELVRLLWAFGSVQTSGSQAKALLVSAVPVLISAAKAGRMNSQDVSNSVWAYARMHMYQEGHQLLEAMTPMLLAPSTRPHKKSANYRIQYPSKQTHLANKQSANVSGATPSLSLPSAESVAQHEPTQHESQQSHAQSEQQQQHAVRHMPQQRLVIQEFGSQEIANLLWSCATLHHSCQRQQWPQQRHVASQGQELAIQLAHQLLRALADRRHHLSQQSLANAAWSATRLGLQATQYHADIVSAMAVSCQQGQQPTVQEVSMALWSCTSLPFEVFNDPTFQESVTQIADTALQQTSQQPLAPAALVQLGWFAGWHEGNAKRQRRRDRNRQQFSQHMHNRARRRREKTDAGSHHEQPHHQPFRPFDASTEVLQLSLSAVASDSATRHETQRSLASDQFTENTRHSGEMHPNREETDSPAVRHLTTVLQDLSYQISHQASTMLNLQPHEMSQLASGLSKAQVRGVDRDLFRDVGDVSVKHIQTSTISPAGVAGLLAAFVRSGVSHPFLPFAAAHAAASNRHQYSIIQLANLIWALTCTRVRYTPLLDRTAAWLLHDVLAEVPSISKAVPASEHYSRHNTQQQAQHVDAASPGDACDRPVNDASTSSDEAFSTYDDTPRSDATSLLKQLGWDPSTEEEDDAQAAQFSHMRRQRPSQSMPPPWRQTAPSRSSHLLTLGREPVHSNFGMAWTVLAWAFARSSYHQHQLYDKLAVAVLTGWTPQQQQYATSQQQLRPQEGESSAVSPSDLYQQSLSLLRADCLVQLVWAFAAHDHSHPLLLHEMAPVLSARIRAGWLSTRQVATVAWAYAKLQHYDDQLFRAILQEAMTNSNRYGLKDWSRLAWAYSTLCLPAEEAFFMRLGQLQRQAAGQKPSTSRQRSMQGHDP